tara:strand:- start:573 stop:896 length:324 start_codon:yes stop_codon:yes gene_type:complete
MNSQIIKNYVTIFEDFIKTNFILENNYYIFNDIVFKKLIYNNVITDFLQNLKQFYFKNKHYYLERNPITLKQFNTIIRQICKKNEIDLKKNVKFNNSKYNIEYHIYL